MISITFSFPNIADALWALRQLDRESLARAVVTSVPLEPAPDASPAPVAPAAEPVAPPKRPRGRPRKTPAPAPAAPAAAPAPAPVQTPAPAPIAPQAQPQAASQPAAAPEPVLTREAVLALIRQAMATVGVGTVRQQFASLGATSISDLPEEKWPTLVANLRNAQKVLG